MRRLGLSLLAALALSGCMNSATRYVDHDSKVVCFVRQRDMLNPTDVDIRCEGVHFQRNDVGGAP